MKTSFLLSTLATLLPFLGRVDAHGYTSKPRSQYIRGSNFTSYVAKTNANINKGFKGGIYNHSPQDNAVQFELHWNRTGYTSLRQMLDPLVPGCGNTLTNIPPVDMTGETEMWWQNDQYKEGFLESHRVRKDPAFQNEKMRGPCEGWLANTKIFHYPNCRLRFPTYPAKIPVDYSKCLLEKDGKCMFTFYWLALHLPEWQVYSTFRTVLSSYYYILLASGAPRVFSSVYANNLGVVCFPIENCVPIMYKGSTSRATTAATNQGHPQPNTVTRPNVRAPGV
ncbi:hypothetical protein PsorP6_014076 [Peronosclerospora sorghi]|uniref:Uncharacterized protein n=1 Tax=Peronosclerospora sorghi TaxID=230839 RepID=A0ACC0VIM7_9STRA|nr:hypothetical protein PsorP6_014076 [Peronosclerospora sorghi]